MASARIHKFDWKAGERFQAEVWLLNDSTAAANEKVKVSLRLGGQTYPLLTWESGNAPAGTNRLGPTANLVLPDVSAYDMTLILDCGNGASSEYRLRYRSSKPVVITRQLNV